MKTTRETFPLNIAINPNSSVSMKDQIYKEIKKLILSGVLKKGDSLPASRILAERLKVGRVTVTAAYQKLQEEGFINSCVGKGTFVEEAAMTEAAHWKKAQTQLFKSKSLSKRAEAARRASEFPVQELRPFAIASPDYESLPGKKWTQIVARVSKSPWQHNGYCEPGGYPPFRQAIADYVHRVRGIDCEAEEVIVTTGIQQGMMLASEILFNAGDKVLLESPGYQPHRNLVEYLSLQPVPMEVNGNWPESTDLDKETDIKGMLVTPSHQYPLGTLMSLEKRLELLKWAQERGVWIIEDDYDGELRYGGAPFPALAAIDQERSSVVYLGSFSKIIYPGFNMGYLIAPKALTEEFKGAKLLNDRHASEVHQVILAEFIAEGHYEAHTRRLKKLYEGRRNAFLNCLGKELKSFGKFIEGNQGTHLTFVFDRKTDDAAVSKFLKKEWGIETRPLSPCYFSEKKKTGLIMGFAGFTEDQIRSAGCKMRKALEQWYNAY